MPQKLLFSSPLSLTGIRKMHLDLTGPLSYNSETLTGTSPTVVSSNTALVTISSAAANTAQLTNKDGTTSAVGKAVEWVCTSAKASTGRVLLSVAWAVAAGGSADTHEIELNLEPKITE